MLGSFALATEACFASRQVQFLNLVVVVPVVQRHGFWFGGLRSCSSSIFLLLVVMQRQVPGFLRTVHRCSSRTSRLMPVSTPKPVEIPQVLFLVAFHARLDAGTRGDSTGAVLGCVHARLDSRYPWRSPQVQFFDKVWHARCYWSSAEGQTAQITVEIPQVPFLDKVYTHARCCCMVQKTVVMP